MLSVLALCGGPVLWILCLLIVSLWNHPAACCPMIFHACPVLLHTITQWGRRLATGRGQVSFQRWSHLSSALVMVHSRKLAVWLLTQITFLFPHLTADKSNKGCGSSPSCLGKNQGVKPPHIIPPVACLFSASSSTFFNLKKNLAL